MATPSEWKALAKEFETRRNWPAAAQSWRHRKTQLERVLRSKHAQLFYAQKTLRELIAQADERIAHCDAMVAQETHSRSRLREC